MPQPRLLLPAALLALASPALAQEAPPDSAHFYKHHFGLTASPVLDHFFTANRSLPIGLLYKHQTKPNRLWRYGLVLNQNYSRQDEYKPNYSPTNLYINDRYTNSNFGLSGSVGREYSQRFAQRWTGTAGADLSIGFSQYKYIRTYQQLGNPATNTPSIEVADGARQRYYQASLAPFAGIRFQLWSSLYISAESAVQFNYLRETVNNLTNVTDLSNGQLLIGAPDFVEQQLRIQRFSLRYRLVNQLSVHYLVGR